MTAIISLIKSLELFLLLKNKLFYYEIREKSRNRQKEIISEIEMLRNNGDSNSSDAADILRAELAREKSEIKHLSAFYSSPQETTPN